MSRCQPPNHPPSRYYAGGSLTPSIGKRAGVSVLRRWLSELGSALQHMHVTAAMVHRDIKSDNVLLSRRWDLAPSGAGGAGGAGTSSDAFAGCSVCLTDFGEAVALNERSTMERRMNPQAGDARYRGSCGGATERRTQHTGTKHRTATKGTACWRGCRDGGGGDRYCSVSATAYSQTQCVHAEQAPRKCCAGWP